MGRARISPPAPVGAVFTLIVLTACGGTSADRPGPDDRAPAPESAGATPATSAAPSPPPPAPWSAPPIEAVAPVYLQEWVRAENRAWCAPMAFSGTGGIPDEGTARPATFGGGWAVAYDLPGLRSAYGIAGTGVEHGPSTYDDWPRTIRWSDGSSAGYGPEGGSGPRQLAYLRVAGQRCLYNVWSNIGIEHLERLLGELRFVAVARP